MGGTSACFPNVQIHDLARVDFVTRPTFKLLLLSNDGYRVSSWMQMCLFNHGQTYTDSLSTDCTTCEVRRKPKTDLARYSVTPFSSRPILPFATSFLALGLHQEKAGRQGLSSTHAKTIKPREKAQYQDTTSRHQASVLRPRLWDKQWKSRRSCLEKFSLGKSRGKSDFPEGRSPKGKSDYPRDLLWANFQTIPKGFPLLVRLQASKTEGNMSCRSCLNIFRIRDCGKGS